MEVEIGFWLWFLEGDPLVSIWIVEGVKSIGEDIGTGHVVLFKFGAVWGFEKVLEIC